MRKVTAWEFLTLNAYFFGLSFLWNSLHLILLPAILLLYVPDGQKNTVLGVLTAAGLVIAMVVQPVSGSVSDRWASRWGRRRPLILFGNLGNLAFLGLLAAAGGVPGLAIGYVGLQFTSNTAHGPAQGLLPDRIPPALMGRGSAVKSALDMLGMIAASLIMGRYLRGDGSNWIPAVGIIAAVMLFTAGMTLLGSREEDSRARAATGSLGVRLGGMFRVQWDTAPGFAWLIVSRFVFLAGVYGVQAFSQYFIRDTLPAEDPVKLTGDLMAVIALSLTATAFGSGWLCDRFGRKPLHVLAAFLVAGGSLLMIPARTAETVLLCGTIIGAGAGVFITANWALATDLAPQAEAGKFLGLTNLATAGAGAFSRLTGPAIDFLNGAAPGSNLGYTALLLSSAAFALLALFVLVRVPEGFRRSAAGLPAEAP
ncbi:MAG: MFS transporter [Anaerolineales bacterium]|nr:MFS transporter [Anaerolineales bacterium]